MRAIPTVPRFMAVLVAAGSCGCQMYTRPVAPPLKLTPAQRNFENVWQASLNVLGRYHFDIDRKDRRAGIITTNPQVGKHWFEFWRHDAVSDRDITESTLQTISRSVTVRISPTEEGASTYAPEVEVLVRRSDRRTPQVTNTSEAYRMFTSPRSGEFQMKGEGVPRGGEAPLGRDANLELVLKARILAAAPQRTPATQPASEPAQH